MLESEESTNFGFSRSSIGELRTEFRLELSDGISSRLAIKTMTEYDNAII